MRELPGWAVVSPKRRQHIERVTMLVAEWTDALQLNHAEKNRWLHAAWLHDALRDELPEVLRERVDADFADWPDALLHGPACARRLREEGEADEGVLRAIAYHTVGHPALDDAGRALYIADYLEPGRTFDPVGRARLRARMPQDRDEVLLQVLGSRISHMINSQRKLRGETLAFWNSIAR